MEDDSIRLLRECDAGIKMGITSIEEIMEHASNERLKKLLEESCLEQKALQRDLEAELDRYREPEKEPAAMAKTMSWMKTNMKIAMKDSDNTVADLVTEGCHMGIKSLYRYMNQYPAAEEKIKRMAERLVELQEKLLRDMRVYL